MGDKGLNNVVGGMSITSCVPEVTEAAGPGSNASLDVTGHTRTVRRVSWDELTGEFDVGSQQQEARGQRGCIIVVGGCHMSCTKSATNITCR